MVAAVATEDDSAAIMTSNGDQNDDLQRISTEDDPDETSDDEEDESISWREELRNSWRQHCVAITVAILATVLAYYYQRIAVLNERSIKILPKQHGRRILQAPTTSLANLSRTTHAHLLGYERTANITFCGRATPLPTEQQLHIMDFHVPEKLIESMKLHFDNPKHHPEVSCLQRLRDSSPQKYIKGVTLFYKTPKFESMYIHEIENQQLSVKQKAPKIQPAHLTFTGFAAKFVNMGNAPVLLFWDGREDKGKLVGELAPFQALSTATKPGESFSVRPVYDHSHALDRWVVTADDAIQYYEPAAPPATNSAVSSSLTPFEQQLYDLQKLNQEFAKHYLIHAQRTWLANFPRAFPVHYMWTAEYFGQQHKVESSTVVQVNENESTISTMTFTLKVVSVTPRVFTIRNFLSNDECDTLIQLALSQGLHGSTVYSGSLAKQQRVTSTRSSSNTWLARDTAALTDQIYQRAAHITKIDESLLQGQAIDDDFDANEHSIAESLQVIRYKVNEQYAPHHDWVLPDQQHRHQPTRFATLLIYLNDDFEGGETTFPRAVNAQYHDGIKITPEKGKAVLFYNMLPDGNVDDLSQHGSEPVKSGEKFAANLWLWDPMIN